MFLGAGRPRIGQVESGRGGIEIEIGDRGRREPDIIAERLSRGAVISGCGPVQIDPLAIRLRNSNVIDARGWQAVGHQDRLERVEPPACHGPAGQRWNVVGSGEQQALRTR